MRHSLERRLRAVGDRLRQRPSIPWTGRRLRSPGADHPRTSITDNSRYPEFCARAAVDPAVFRTFRRAAVYVETLEHVTRDQGADYLRIIRRDNPALLDGLEEIRRNDACGSPVTFQYPGIGEFSPVTLRYLKVVSDLERHFGDLSGLRIVEIGVGYGGQCRLIMSRWRVQSYTLVDLDGPLHLARTYLETLQASGRVIFYPAGAVEPGAFDLSVSNYSFSELARPVQDQYADAILTGSTRGYLTCNFVSSEFGVHSWARDEYTRISHEGRWIPEDPQTHDLNAIFLWGTNQVGNPNLLDGE